MISPLSYNDTDAANLIIPLVDRHPLMMDLALACGALNLSWTVSHVEQRAEQYYLNVIVAIRQAIEQPENQTAEWMLATVLIMALYEKFSGCATDRIITHLSGANFILRQRLARRDIRLTPVEVLLTEFFLYSTTLTILYCTESDLEKLPQSSIFIELEPVLLHHSRKNRTLEPNSHSSFSLHHMVAQVSWLSRKNSLSSDDYLSGQRLLNQLHDWNGPAIPVSSTDNSSVSSTFSDRVLVCKATQQATIILLHKILDPQSHDASPHFQLALKEGLQYVELIPDNSQKIGALVWPLSLFGLASVNDHSRQQVLKRLLKVGELLHTAMPNTAVNLIKDAWEGNIGLSMIFDRSRMAQVGM